MSHPSPQPSNAFTNGDPNGSVVGNPGDERFDPIARTFWFKEAGNNNTSGWIEKLTLDS